MFQFSDKAKRFSWILIGIGLIALVFNFVSFGGTHGEEATHATEAHADHGAATDAHATEGAHGATAAGHDVHSAQTDPGATAAHAEPDHGAHAEAGHEDGGHHATLAHNKPWSRLLVATFFFVAISLGALFFLAIQYAAQAGWSVVVLRIMEAVASFLPVPLAVMLLLIVLGVVNVHHIWHWMTPGISDPASPHYDAIIAGKTPYLNAGFFIGRALIYAIGWILAARWLRSASLRADAGSAEDGTRIWKRARQVSAVFLVFFAVTSSTMAWDWIMSIDTHWFSTLFGWYTFAGMFVSAVTVITMIAVYLKMNGYLPELNQNHLHDLGKFMFAFSIFWTYLWFSQYMLIWYANIPEEVTYYMVRFREYKAPMLTFLVLNFLAPLLVLMSRDSKRNLYFVMVAGSIILLGHFLDHFVMIMPGSVGTEWSFGLIDLGLVALYAGLFIQVVFRSLTKAALVPAHHPMLTESKLHHI